MSCGPRAAHGLPALVAVLIAALSPAAALSLANAAEAKPAAVRTQPGVRVTAEPATCSLRAPTPPGLDFSGKRLEAQAFSGRDLRNANFEGATLVGVAFIHTKLQGANFRNAVMQTGSGPGMALPVDFSAANLDNACFIGAKFTGRTYFTAANLSSADFSQQDLTTSKATFGDQPWRVDDPSRRPIFRGATMNCEFIGQWNRLDLSNADLSACTALYATPAGTGPGHDFSGAVLNGVSFENVDLSRSRWAGAQLVGARFQGAILDDATGLAGNGPADPRLLAGAVFTNASLRNVDLSHAQLYGADFTNAELNQVNLYGAYLGQGGGIDRAAVFDGAHMKFVNLANADLTGTMFRYASLYADRGSTSNQWRCSIDVANCPGQRTGSTCSCATAAGATLTGATFTNAFLYGVDFGGSTTIVRGTDFSGAVLVAASFRGATIGIEADPARPVSFDNAWLHGADLSGTQLASVSFNNAGIDFGVLPPGKPLQLGNFLYLQLADRYTPFRSWSGASRTPCVKLLFLSATTMPALDSSNHCPDGNRYDQGCGPQLPAPNPNPTWNAKTTPALSYWFQRDATYAGAAVPASICGNGGQVERAW